MSMITPITVEGFPRYARPWNNITPFTYRDGLTYLEVLEGLRLWLKDTLVPHIDSEMVAIGEAWNDEVIALVSAVETALAEQAGIVNEQVAQWMSTTIANNDEITLAILKGATATRSEISTIIANDIALNVAVKSAIDSVVASHTTDIGSDTFSAISGAISAHIGKDGAARAAFDARVAEIINPLIAGSFDNATVRASLDSPVTQIINDPNSSTQTAIDARIQGVAATIIASDPTIIDAAIARLSDSAVTAALAWQKTNVTASTDFNTLVSPGAYSISAIPTDYAMQNMPVNSRGTLNVYSIIDNTSVLQVYTTWTSGSSISFSRSLVSGVWHPWSMLGPGSEALSASVDFNTLSKPGNYSLSATPIDWPTQNMPTSIRGVLTVYGMNTSSAFIQAYVTWEAVPRLFIRQYSAGAFGGWREIGSSSNIAANSVSAASGMKIVGVPITAGHSGTDAPLAGNVRMPVKFEAPITRYRLVFHDINSRYGVTRNGEAIFTGVWFGSHEGNGVMSEAEQIVDAFTIPDTSIAYKTPWINKPIQAGVESIISFGYEKASAPWAMLGYSYQNADKNNASVSAPSGMAKMGTVPFTITIEAETYSHTPVIASMGDSNSVGIGTSNVIFDSWLSVLCRNVKALPVHLGSSGDSVAGSLNAETFKFNRFDGLSRPDAVIFALGQNDAAVNGATSEAIIPNINTVISNLKSKVSSNIYAVNYMPRTANPWAGFEDVRRAITAHLNTLPGGIRDVFDIAAAVSNDDETLRAEFNADGTHINSAGTNAVAGAINRPVTTPPVMYVV